MDVAGITYKLNIPTKVYYGRSILCGTFSEALRNIKGSSDRILIVTTGRSLIKLGHLERLLECISRCDKHIMVSIYDNISSNPCLDEIEAGAEKAEGEQINTVIGFGGGSALDAAKAISAAATSDMDVTKMFREGIEPGASLPLIAIPTTAGTGSELSKAAILTDKANKKKGGVRGNKLYPNVAIVDSELTDTVPFNTTMETGFDVLAHAIESYVSRKASPFTEMLSEYVIKEAGDSIKKLAEDLANKEARDKMSFCSMVMGINLGNTGTALPHRLQYPVGAHTDSSHGAGLAAMYPSWLRYEEKYAKDKVYKIYDMLGIQKIEELLELMRINRNLTELGVNADEMELFPDEVSGSIENDPASQEKDIIEMIYKESM